MGQDFRPAWQVRPHEPQAVVGDSRMNGDLHRPAQVKADTGKSQRLRQGLLPHVQFLLAMIECKACTRIWRGNAVSH
jgi:hypothetical protein